jgi:hypothetical protein
MRHSTRWIVVGTVSGAVAVAGAGIAVAAGGGDDIEPAITGSDLERAGAAALDHTGGGRVTGTEVGDEDSWYEVEVTLDDGSQRDVQLDRRFRVVGATADAEDAADQD